MNSGMGDDEEPVSLRRVTENWDEEEQEGSTYADYKPVSVPQWGSEVDDGEGEDEEISTSRRLSVSNRLKRKNSLISEDSSKKKGVGIGVEVVQNGEKITDGEINLDDYMKKSTGAYLAKALDDQNAKLGKLETANVIVNKAAIVETKSQLWEDRVETLKEKLDEISQRMQKEMGEVYMKRLLEKKIDDYSKFYSFLETAIPKIVVMARLDMLPGQDSLLSLIKDTMVNMQTLVGNANLNNINKKGELSSTMSGAALVKMASAGSQESQHRQDMGTITRNAPYSTLDRSQPTSQAGEPDDATTNDSGRGRSKISSKKSNASSTNKKKKPNNPFIQPTPYMYREAYAFGSTDPRNLSPPDDYVAPEYSERPLAEDELRAVLADQNVPEEFHDDVAKENEKAKMRLLIGKSGDVHVTGDGISKTDCRSGNVKNMHVPFVLPTKDQIPFTPHFMDKETVAFRIRKQEQIARKEWHEMGYGRRGPIGLESPANKPFPKSRSHSPYQCTSFPEDRHSEQDGNGPIKGPGRRSLLALRAAGVRPELDIGEHHKRWYRDPAHEGPGKFRRQSQVKVTDYEEWRRIQQLSETYNKRLKCKAADPMEQQRLYEQFIRLQELLQSPYDTLGNPKTIQSQFGHITVPEIEDILKANELELTADVADIILGFSKNESHHYGGRAGGEKKFEYVGHQGDKYYANAKAKFMNSKTESWMVKHAGITQQVGPDVHAHDGSTRTAHLAERRNQNSNPGVTISASNRFDYDMRDEAVERYDQRMHLSPPSSTKALLLPNGGVVIGKEAKSRSPRPNTSSGNTCNSARGTNNSMSSKHDPMQAMETTIELLSKQYPQGIPPEILAPLKQAMRGMNATPQQEPREKLRTSLLQNVLKKNETNRAGGLNVARATTSSSRMSSAGRKKALDTNLKKAQQPGWDNSKKLYQADRQRLHASSQGIPAVNTKGQPLSSFAAPAHIAKDGSVSPVNVPPHLNRANYSERTANRIPLRTSSPGPNIAEQQSWVAPANRNFRPGQNSRPKKKTVDKPKEAIRRVDLSKSGPDTNLANFPMEELPTRRTMETNLANFPMEELPTTQVMETNLANFPMEELPTAQVMETNLANFPMEELPTTQTMETNLANFPMKELPTTQTMETNLASFPMEELPTTQEMETNLANFPMEELPPARVRPAGGDRDSMGRAQQSAAEQGSADEHHHVEYGPDGEEEAWHETEWVLDEANILNNLTKGDYETFEAGYGVGIDEEGDHNAAILITSDLDAARPVETTKKDLAVRTTPARRILKEPQTFRKAW